MHTVSLQCDATDDALRREVSFSRTHLVGLSTSGTNLNTDKQSVVLSKTSELVETRRKRLGQDFITVPSNQAASLQTHV